MFAAGAAQVGAAGVASPEEQAQRILKATGVRGGLVVHLGCGDGKLTAAFGASRGYLVHGLAWQAAEVERARRHIRGLGRYGRVSVELQRGDRLPYVDNLVNLVVAERLGEVPPEEVMRVLAPGGVAYVRRGEEWTKSSKPWPESIDQWTHFMHGPDNNAVAGDEEVGPPRHIQWVGPPPRARQHENLASISAVVSAGGRLFSIQDEGPIASVVLPPRWYLVARDAFNGVILWKRRLRSWENHQRPFRMGPPDLARRLVAVEDRVYVTLGYGEAVSALDAATGHILTTYKGTEGAREIICDGGVLYVVQASGEKPTTATLRGDHTPANRIVVIEADTGRVVWQKADADTAAILPVTLAVSRGRVLFQNPEAICCLDGATGQVLWRAGRVASLKRPGFSAPTLVVYGDVVLSADRATPQEVAREPERVHKTPWVDAPTGELVALSLATGQKLWSSPCRECFNAPVDVLVTDGLVWTGQLVIASEPGITTGRDPKTGQVRRQRPPDQTFFEVGMPHHRCYRNRATPRYLVLGRAGVEFIDVASGQAIPHHWIRGTCQFGVLPCNGLLYVPPHSCACYSQAKLNGFCALAAARKGGERRAESRGQEGKPRLERGRAYEETGTLNPQPSTDWPTYRHDAARSGATPVRIKLPLRRAWQTELGARLTSPVVAGGKVFVATVDSHMLHALDAQTGQPLWQFTAAGRIDSPPTIWQGRALFGSADGWIYCLSASDGGLIWRWQAAPQDQRIVAYGQLESVWPLHGSVLVKDAVVWYAAGRCSYLDGGIVLGRLDAATGRPLSETRIDSRDPTTGWQKRSAVAGFDLQGALPDVLSTDGRSVFMGQTGFDGHGQPTEVTTPHLLCPTGLLDDSWWHRSYWVWGTRFYTGYRDWFRAGRERPAGRLLVWDAESVYGFGYRPEYYYWSTPLEYHLFRTSKEPELVDSPVKRNRVPGWGQRQVRYDWSRRLPLLVRAMVLAADTLFVAGPPDVVDEREAHRRRHDPAVQAQLAEQVEALAGRRGGRLWAFRAADGQPLAELTLEAPPVWDGMVAAADRLYLSTTAGTVACFEPQRPGEAPAAP